MQSSRSASASHGSSSGTPKSGTLWHRCGAGERGCGQKADMVNRAPTEPASRAPTHRQTRSSRALDQPLRWRARAGRDRLQRAGVAARTAQAQLGRGRAVACSPWLPAANSAQVQVRRTLALRHAALQRGEVPVARTTLLVAVSKHTEELRSAPAHRGSPMRCGAARGARMR
jgi:hypothetical protein